MPNDRRPSPDKSFSTRDGRGTTLRWLSTAILPERRHAKYREALAEELNQLPLLGRSQPIELEKFFVPLRLVDPEKAQDSDLSTATIGVWDALFRSPRLIVVGKVGTGKSTLLRYLALRFARNAMPAGYVRRMTFAHHAAPVDELLPVYIPLQEFGNSSGDLLDYALGSFAHYGFPNARSFLLHRLQESQCLLLIDGLDETEDRRVAEGVARFATDFPRNQIIVAMRHIPEGYDLPDFTVLELIGFDEKERETFAQQVIGARSATFVALIQALERNEGLRRLGSAPLLLSSMILRATQGPSPLQLGPLYEACLQTLLTTWPETRHLSPSASLPPALQEVIAEELSSLLLHRQWRSLPRDEMLAALQEATLAVGATAISREDLLKALMTQSGILRCKPDGSYSLVDCALQNYLTARKAVREGKIKELVARASDLWWHEVIILAAGLSQDATETIHLIQQRMTDATEALFLSAQCLPDAPDTDETVRDQIISTLFQIFERDEPDNWARAAMILAGIHGQRIRDFLTGVLQDEDPSLRRQGALALGRLGEEWTVGPLVAALVDNDWQVRTQISWALGRTGDKRVISPLISALRDPNREVAEEAARSLSLLGQESIRPLIIALEDEREQVHQLAASALADIGEEALEPVVEALTDDEQRLRVREGAADALAQWADPRTIPTLINTLTESREGLREAVVRALGKMGPPAIEPLIADLSRHDVGTAMALADALSRIGQAAIAPLIDALDGESPEVRSAAIKALQCIGAPAVPALTKALSDKRWNVRRRAAQILPTIGDDLIVAPLVAALADKDEGVRAKAARALAEMGDGRAVEPLAKVLRTDSDESVRRESAKALGNLGDSRAVEPLIEALEDVRLRRAAQTALANLGEIAVVPLVSFLHTADPGETRDAARTVLSELGGRGRAEEPTLLGLAKCYQVLLSRPFRVEEVVELTAQMRWWEWGDEIHRSFKAARTFLACHSLEGVVASGRELEWIRHSEDWLRPAIRSVLWRLGDVIESIRVYHSDPSREGQRNALLSATDVLDEIQRTTERHLLPFESSIFGEVAGHWRTLVGEAIKRMRGRADLEMELLTDRLALRDSQSIAMLVFRLTNVGDSSARNLRVTLKPTSGGEFEVLGEQPRSLDPLGSGMQREIEIPIRPRGARAITFSFEVQYDDDERENYSRPFSGRVSFYEIDTAYRTIIISPYLAGKPIKTQDMFFGRRDVFDWVRSNISGQHGENVLVLFGERRMGKTSILYQLRNTPPTPRHTCVLFSMEMAAYVESVADLLYEITLEICDALEGQEYAVPEPEYSDYLASPHRRFRAFIRELERSLGDRRIVLMVDEFGILIDKVQKGVLGNDIFSFLRGIIQETDKLAFLFTGAIELRRMQKDYGSILFNLAKVRKISYLERAEAERLITVPAQGLVDYHPLVVRKILRVTAGHPYFIQYICDSLVRLAQREKKNLLDLVDVNLVLQETVRDTTGNIENSLYANLSEPEKRALSGLANVTDDIRFFVPLDSIHDILERKRLAMPRRELMQALEYLKERDLIQERRLGQQLQYSFKMGIVRMWLKQAETLLRISEELAR